MSPYLDPDDFRSASLASACAGLVLDDLDDVPLAGGIASASLRIDDWTVDHFQPPSPDNDVTLNVDAEGTSRLYLPRRCRSVTSVKLRNPDGTLTAAATTSGYRLRSSLNAAGSELEDGRMLDWIDVVYGGVGLPAVAWGGSIYGWPCGVNTVEVIGKFDWAVVPWRVQRAVALMVYDLFQPSRAGLHVAESLQTDTQVVRFKAPDISAGVFTGIDEADGIIQDLRRAPRVLVG